MQCNHTQSAQLTKVKLGEALNLQSLALDYGCSGGPAVQQKPERQLFRLLRDVQVYSWCWRIWLPWSRLWLVVMHVAQLGQLCSLGEAIWGCTSRQHCNAASQILPAINSLRMRKTGASHCALHGCPLHDMCPRNEERGTAEMSEATYA